MSEGIDLKDALCRVVILIGIPYPNVKEPFVKCKILHAKDQLDEVDWL